MSTPNISLNRKKEVDAVASLGIAVQSASGEVKSLVQFFEKFADFISQGKSPTPPPAPGGGQWNQEVLDLLAEQQRLLAEVLRAAATVHEKAAVLTTPSV